MARPLDKLCWFSGARRCAGWEGSLPAFASGEVDGWIRLHPLAEESGKATGHGRTDPSCGHGRVLRASAEELTEF